MPLCGFEAITHLINYGMALDQRTNEGKTILHDWTGQPIQIDNEGRKEDSIAVIAKLLVEKGADLTALDDYGFTPIFVKASHCEEFWFRPKLNVFDYLLERDSINLIERVEALEVVGAVILQDPKMLLYI